LPTIAPSDTVSSRRLVFKTKTLSRWLRKTTLSDRHLCNAVAEMSAGLIEADLGGHVFKKRVAAPVVVRAEARESSSQPILAIAGSLCTDSRRTSEQTSTIESLRHFSSSLAYS
jgi:hypothetical protein